MRLDARNGQAGCWDVWDCEAMRVVPAVLWVDDCTAEFCCYVLPTRVGLDGELVTEMHRAKRIQICFHSRVVLINPIADHTDEQVATVIHEPAIA